MIPWENIGDFYILRVQWWMGLEGVLGIIGCHGYYFLMTKQLERSLFFLWSDYLKGLSKQCQRSSDFVCLNALAFFYSFVKPIAYVSFSLPSSLRLLDFTDNRIFCLHSINYVRSRSGGSHVIHGGEHCVTSARAAAKETCTVYTEVSTLGSGL